MYVMVLAADVYRDAPGVEVYRAVPGVEVYRDVPGVEVCWDVPGQMCLVWKYIEMCLACAIWCVVTDWKY